MCGPLTSKRLYARMAELVDALVLGTNVNWRVGSSPTLSTTKVLYTDLLFKLPLITQTRNNTDGVSMWLAAKDLVKINEGEVKERAHTIAGCLFRQLH